MLTGGGRRPPSRGGYADRLTRFVDARAVWPRPAVTHLSAGLTMPKLPSSIQQFIQQQKTIPVDELWKADRDSYRSAYSSYWYRAVACLLLSGRIHPKANGYPNMTDATRVSKEANFNSRLLERIAKLFIRAKVLKIDPQGRYTEGPGFVPWWDNDVEKLRGMTRTAFLELVQEGTGFQPWRPTDAHHSQLVEFLQLFVSCFQGKALPEASAGLIIEAFSRLPKVDLLQAAKAFRIDVHSLSVSSWKDWLDGKGQKGLIAALYTTEWAWYGEHNKIMWLLLSPLGEGMLGLQDAPPPPELSADLKVLPSNSIFAGPGLAMDRLVPLFRFCKIKRIDQLYEFQLDRKHLTEMPSHTSPARELRKVLQAAGPLPATVEDTLDAKPMVGGTVGIRWCSALVQPGSAEVHDAIKQHPRLKGYLEAGAPPGYLLLKARSSPEKFMQRCQELGFRVTMS
jgi:hypothetical protein